MESSPGSKEAWDRGCTCPVMGNAWGQGVAHPANTGVFFWINAACPLHGESSPKQEAEHG